VLSKRGVESYRACRRCPNQVGGYRSACQCMPFPGNHVYRHGRDPLFQVRLVGDMLCDDKDIISVDASRPMKW
jgi:hypothetical protein